MDLGERKKLNSMTNDMVDAALNSKTKLSYEGSDVDVENIDGLKEQHQIEEDNKEAVKLAW